MRRDRLRLFCVSVTSCISESLTWWRSSWPETCCCDELRPDSASPRPEGGNAGAAARELLSPEPPGNLAREADACVLSAP